MPLVLENQGKIIESKFNVVNSFLIVLFVGLQGGVLAVSAPFVGNLVFQGTTFANNLGSAGAILLINTLQAIGIGVFAFLSGLYIKKFSAKSALYIGITLGLLFDFTIGFLLLASFLNPGINIPIFIIFYIIGVAFGGSTVGILYNISSSSITSTVHNHKKSNLFLNFHSGFYTLGIAIVSLGFSLIFPRTTQYYWLFFAVGFLQIIYLMYAVFSPFFVKEIVDLKAWKKIQKNRKKTPFNWRVCIYIFAAFVLYVGVGILNGGLTPYLGYWLNTFTEISNNVSLRNLLTPIVLGIFFLGATVGNFIYGAILANKYDCEKIIFWSAIISAICFVIFVVLLLLPFSPLSFFSLFSPIVVFIFLGGGASAAILPAILNMTQKVSNYRSGSVNGATLGFSYLGLWFGAFWIGLVELFLPEIQIFENPTWYIFVFSLMPISFFIIVFISHFVKAKKQF